jgi:hypothetical protein
MKNCFNVKTGPTYSDYSQSLISVAKLWTQ